VITLYHNPACSKSRETLALIRAAGIEPVVIDYLQNPLSRHDLEALRAALGLSVVCLLRTGDARYAQLGLDAPDCSDETRIQALLAEPSLFNRPVAVSTRGARICRPPETVLDILPVQ
ncbi:MAG: Arsenate reductase, partial [Pseudomonadota bacterium]|jgi:arsenate reductase